MPGAAEFHCLNCGEAVAAHHRHCAGCGQRTSTGRLTLADTVRDLMHSFVDIERSAFAFVWALLTRPGTLALDYVRGRRRRYFGPFATLAVVVGAAALAINLTGFQVLAQDGLARAPTDLFQRHFNLVLLAQLPLLGLAGLLMFGREGLNFFEHMVLAAYALSVRASVLIVFVGLAYLTSFATPTRALVFAQWGAWYLYYGWAASQFYSGPRTATWLRGSVVAALAHAAIMGLAYGADDVYGRLAR